jgi:hypothetical protein
MHGMTGRWPGYAVPVAVLLVTLGLTMAMALVAGGTDVSDPASGVGLLLLMPAPLFVAIAWGGALLIGRPHRLAALAAAVWFGTAWFLVPHGMVWQLVGHVTAGLLGGLALGRHWRLDAAVLAVALALSPILVWTSVHVPPAEQVEVFRTEMLKTVEQNLPAGADADQKARALAEQDKQMERIGDLAARIYPFVLGIGVLGQAGIILSVLWLVIRSLGMAPTGWRLPPFTRWRVPFYVVWVLAAGLGLLVTRHAVLARAGLNLALLAACVLGVQGLAVQFQVTGRMMSRLGRVIYWSLMGIFFAPLALASGVVLGLVDQWWDIRRLDADDDNET